MADNQQRKTSLILTVLLVGLNLVALNYLISGWSGARLDLTEEGVFSISPSTRRILNSLDEDLTIYAYFSDRTHPKLAPLVPQIVDLLEEYRSVSGGRVGLEIIDPGEDEDAEQEAADRFGVRSTPFQLSPLGGTQMEPTFSRPTMIFLALGLIVTVRNRGICLSLPDGYIVSESRQTSSGIGRKMRAFQLSVGGRSAQHIQQGTSASMLTGSPPSVVMCPQARV